MTGLVYSSYTTNLDSLHRIGRPFHPHHSSHHHQHHHHLLQEGALDLRSLVMLEENAMTHRPSPMFPVSPKEHYGNPAGGTDEFHGPQKHPEDQILTLENHYVSEHRSPLPGDSGGVNHTPQQEQHQSRAHLSESGSSTGMVPAVNVLPLASVPPPDSPGGANMTLEDGKRMDMMSPVSNASSDLEEDVNDNISCGKSDSSADSPNCKQRRSGSAPGNGGQGGDGGGGLGASDKKVYRCQHCKYVTDRKNNLKRHVVTMHEVCTKTLECCDVLFKNKASLRDHVVACHKNGYDCRTCGRTFCRKALLKRHITVHSGQKDYICGVCGYATSHKSNLDRHKRRHGPKFSSDESEQSTPPSSLRQQQQFTPLKPSPLDVSNLVSNHSESPSKNYFPQHTIHHQHHHHIQPNYTGFITTTLHRPEPIKPELYPAAGSPQLAAVADTNSLRASHDFWPPKRHRTNGRHILAKRLLYTYRRDPHLSKTLEDVNTNIKIDTDKKQESLISERLNNNNDNDNSESEAKKKVVWKTDRSFTAKRMLTKRLFPTLYMCRRCSVVYENQLQLTRHIEKDHRDDDCPQLPKRPLTLQARPRAW